jgi:hypothetical protein
MADARHAQALEARRFLPGQRDTTSGPLVQGQGIDAFAVETDLAALRGITAATHQAPGQRRLARTVGAEQHVNLARCDAQLHLAQDGAFD